MTVKSLSFFCCDFVERDLLWRYSWDKLNMVEFDKIEFYESNTNKNESIPYWFHFNALVLLIKIITDIW